MQTTGHDAFLWYNVEGWGRYGLAVPNPGDDLTSQNATIRDLVQVAGRNLQGIMFHVDAKRRTPPTINTITRMHKLCVRARQILAARTVPHNVPNMESVHSVPAPEDFLLYPVPYFEVRNTWLKLYCGLILEALTNAIQFTENIVPNEISPTFAGAFGQYIQRVYKMMAMELLMIPKEIVDADNFTLTDELLRTYDPSKWFTQTEMIDTVPDLENWPTEDELFPLTQGIAASRLPLLARWPSSRQTDQPLNPGDTSGQRTDASGGLSASSWPQNNIV